MAESMDYSLFPCSGRGRLNIPRGHIYKVVDNSLGKSIGFITKEVADKKFGKDKYYLSNSDSLCPICRADIMTENGIQLIL